MLPPEDIEDILKGVEKHDDAYIDNYIALTEKRISSLELFALIAALVAGAAVAELSSFDPKAWRSENRSYVYVALMVFSVAVSTYCSVVVVMTLAAANRLMVVDTRLKDRTVRELYEEYERPGTLLNHIKNTQEGWSVFLEKHGTRIINFPVSLQWISEKYEELRPYIQLFPISTATFVLALLLRVLEKVEYSVLRILIVGLALPLLWLMFLHSRRANEITFFEIGLQLTPNTAVGTHTIRKLEESSTLPSATAKRNLLEESGTGPSAQQHERTPLLGQSRAALDRSWTDEDG